MELLNWTTFLIAVPAVLFAGISKGGFGSGAAFASASILALAVSPGAALGIMLPLLMLIDMSSLAPYWRQWDWRASRILLIGAVPGTILGAVFYARADDNAIRLLIGLICVLFVAYQLSGTLGLHRFREKRFGPRVGLVAGVGMGFTSFVSHAGGPIAAVYLLGQGISKTTYQATTVLVFWAANVVKCGLYAFMGIFTLETLTLDLALAPFALLGTYIGVKLHRIVPEQLFFGLTYVLLSITGSKLVFDALT